MTSVPILQQILADEQASLAASGVDADSDTKILAALTAMIGAQHGDTDKLLLRLAVLKGMLEQVLNLLGPPPDTDAANVRFAVPTYRNPTTGEEVKMAQSLVNDAVSNIPLEFDNLAGQPVAAPTGGTVTITVMDESVDPPVVSTAATAALGADGTSVDVHPTPFDGTNLAAFTVMFEDAANADLKASLDCVFTNDPNAANVHFVTSNVTTHPGP